MKKKTKVDVEEIANNFKVVLRVRPPLPREMQGDKGFVNVASVDTKQSITLSENLGQGDNGMYNTHSFTFDYVYDPASKQSDVYENTAKDAVVSTLQGYNACIIAYGQTGTGKTYTMEGLATEEELGIIPRATQEIFNYIQNLNKPNIKFLVRASYLQIYCENISDLLKPERTHLIIREDKKKGVYVEGLSEWVVRSPAEIYGLMEKGGQVRATGSTKMNELSSRSHAVFIIIVEQSEMIPFDEHGEEVDFELYRKLATEGKWKGDVRQSFKIGKLNLIDLAGSERVRFSGATGTRLEESKKINQSLSALGKVIAALTEAKPHIPYRDSKLTRLLEDSLGGNCKTTMMALISPAIEAFNESLSTLKFAHRAKSIKNMARINEDLDQRALLRRYEQELKKLRTELETKNKHVVDKRKLLELEEQKKRAEEDKLAAITALEKRSREYMMEKQAKRQLEQKILMMQSQLLVGGQKIEETAEFKNLLKQEYQRVHKEYEDKMAELEKERQSIEEDKAQVDRYKQLLLKQRDIMIALTARLNERDEAILGLQEELDAYDRHQRMLEDSLDRKAGALIQLKHLVIGANSPAMKEQLFHIFSKCGIDYDLEKKRRGNSQMEKNATLTEDVIQPDTMEMQLEMQKLRDENQALQAELEKSRLSSSYMDVDSSKLQNRAKLLDDENKLLRAKLHQLSSQPSQDVDNQTLQQLNTLKQACITKEKEKFALKTILETKVKTMIDHIYQCVKGLTSDEKDTVLQIKSTIINLNQLVNASIAALSANEKKN